MIAVNLPLSSLSDPKLSPRPIAVARRSLSATLFVGGICGLSTKAHSLSRRFTGGAQHLAFTCGVRQCGQFRFGVCEQAHDRFLKIVLRRAEPPYLKFGPGFVVLQPFDVQPEDL